MVRYLTPRPSHSERKLFENTEKLGGKKIHPSSLNRMYLTASTQHEPSPYSRILGITSRQYLKMLKPFNEQAMSLIDGGEWW